MTLRRSAVARGACAGVCAGAVAALVDFGLARVGARQFLPDSTAPLATFLLALYAGLGGLAGAALFALSALAGRLTDGGAIAAAAFAPDAAERRGEGAGPRDGSRVAAWALAALAGCALVGAGAWGVTLTALLRFHGRDLIAALCGAASALLAIPAAAVALILARALSPLLRFGPRVRTRPASPAAWITKGWMIGLGAAAGGVMLLVRSLEAAPRMNPPARALNTALWAPVIVLGALGVAHFGMRFAWRSLGRRFAWRWLERPAGAVLAPLGLLAVAAAVATAWTWPLATLLPWKPLFAGAVALFAFAIAALAGAGARLDGRSIALRLGVLLLPLALFALALHLGGAERVRKAAITHAGLAGPLIDALHAASDLDRDGYSSLLGSDCDDWNADVHPGAFDWPDDGVDDDCNGHQATSQAAPRPPFPPRPAGIPDRPNVILISVDALRADHLGAYGYGKPTSPHIDAFARDAVLFKNGWAHSPSTRYSVPAILTGRYESTIAWGSPAQHWPPPVLASNRLLAEMFHDHGYRTAAFLPYHYFERAWGLDQGFDDYDYSLSRLHANPFRGDPAKTTGSSSKELADLVIQWIGEHKGEPFFLWTHFYDPHYLYEKHPEVPPFADCKTDSDCYDGEIAFTDLHLERVFQALRDAGLWDKSIIIVTSDHGEGLGEHGIKLHGYDLYVQQLKVPFIVRVPGIAPRVVDEPVGHVDLFPTLLNLLGAPDEPQLLGRSFVDLLVGAPASGGPERAVFQEVEYEGPVVKKAIATRDWHLIDNLVPHHTVELYRLSDDPQEAHDLAGLGASEERTLRGRLAEWMDQSAVPADFAARVAGNLSMSPLPFADAIGADVGGFLSVDGAEVKTREVRAGGEAEVDLVMHALAKIPAGWKMFTHFTARDGRFLNADHAPLGNLVPLQKLKAGQYVRDPIKVAVPAGWPPGPLSVEVGLFQGGQRASVRSRGGAGNNVLAATVQVVR